MKNKPWDLCFVETHVPDYLNHLYLTAAEPLSNTAPEVRKAAERCFTEGFASIDRMIGEVTQDADQDTLIVIVADHGGTPTTAQARARISTALEAAGLADLPRGP